MYALLLRQAGQNTVGTAFGPSMSETSAFSRWKHYEHSVKSLRECIALHQDGKDCKGRYCVKCLRIAPASHLSGTGSWQSYLMRSSWVEKFVEIETELDCTACRWGILDHDQMKDQAEVRSLVLYTFRVALTWLVSSNLNFFRFQSGHVAFYDIIVWVQVSYLLKSPCLMAVSSTKS